MRGLMLVLSVILVLSLISCGPSAGGGAFSTTPLDMGTPVYMDGILLVTLPSGSVVERVDLTVLPKVRRLYESGKLKVFFGVASTPSPFPEEGYASARLEALSQMAQFISTRVRSVETKMSTTISNAIEDPDTRSQVFGVTINVLKRTQQLFTDVRIYGGREIIWYRYHRPGELPRYGVVILYDPDEALMAIMASESFQKAWRTALEEFKKLGTAGEELSLELKKSLKESLGVTK